MKIELTPTDDGSPTLYLPDIDEHYHSTKGALTESMHVYLHSGFLHRLETGAGNQQIRVLEVGFGTGLNAMLTASAARCSSFNVHYISLENFPLEQEIVNNLDFGREADKAIFKKVHDALWDSPEEIIPGFILEKRLADFLNDPLPKDIDVVYMDAFGPDKQPEMWSDEALGRLVESMAPGGVLTTYSAKGSVRRSLASLGLTVERLAGPPGGKREILRATKPNSNN